MFVSSTRGEKRREPRLAWRLTCVLLASWALLACHSPTDQSGASLADGNLAPILLEATDFDRDRAWENLRALDQIGDRSVGSRGSEQARRILSRRLRDHGADVQEWRLGLASSAGDVDDGEASSDEATSLLGVWRGESDDIVLLAASFDSSREAGEGQERCASGAAAVVEIARALSEGERPYTVWVALIDGDGLAGSASPYESNGLDVGLRFPGSLALAQAMAERGALERVRFAVFLHDVADHGLVVARDLRSDKAFREAFWESARDLEQTAHFRPDQELSSPSAGHLAFLELGLRRVVSIGATTREAGSPMTDGSNHGRSSECSIGSLGAVGSVSVNAVRRINDRLSRIDRFADSPLRMAPEVALPGASPGDFEPPLELDSSDPADASPADVPSPREGSDTPPAAGT